MTITRINRGRGHSYKLDGKPVTGVTTLIGAGLPKNLEYWSARRVAEYVADADPDTIEALRTLGRDGMVKALKSVPWTERDAAAVRGTRVHKLAETLVAGEEVDVPDDIAGHVGSCVRFLDEWRVAPVLVEPVVASRRHRYAGTADLIADLPDGRRCLFDYKTAQSGIWPSTALQLAAYRHAEVYQGYDKREGSVPDLGIVATYAVWLRADGYDVLPVNTDLPVFAAFLDVAAVARHVDVAKSWIGEAEQWAAVPA